MTGPVANTRRLAWHKMGERHGRAGDPPTIATFPTTDAAAAYRTGYRIGKRAHIRESAHG